MDALIFEGLTVESFSHDYINFFGFFNGRLAHTLNQIFETIFQDELAKPNISSLFLPIELAQSQVPYIPESEIEESCKKLLT